MEVDWVFENVVTEIPINNWPSPDQELSRSAPDFYALVSHNVNFDAH